jgi:hypothetical protein
MSSTFHGYIHLLLVLAIAIVVIPVFLNKKRSKD